ncbi:HD family hydrolase [Aureimonas fodinaquatilis]|uniref:HD family hydrolase n=1 Tax=Aureimonas fodinaquatilis TaxID=2565783 RepID=A0A5B0DW21_9HYPH|nr:HD family hydrolase [Aureimonas fodinaquatilis]KAA0971027.1 HD family hydrolase [Aureimonas fodinaquatilis]
MSQTRTSQRRVWQRMLSGRRLDLIDPSPLDIEVEDIAHGLARVARWNGQTRGEHAYSVAQHSLVVEWIMATETPDPRWGVAALLHDGPEYVIGDMISPFKSVLGDDYKSVENRLQKAIHLRFGLPATLPAPVSRSIKKADRISAFYEATLLAGFTVPEASSLFCKKPPLAIPETFFEPKSARAVEQMFMQRFHQLDAAVHSQPGLPS